jgi:hypothetical protein
MTYPCVARNRETAAAQRALAFAADPEAVVYALIENDFEMLKAARLTVRAKPLWRRSRHMVDPLAFQG